MVSGLTDLVTVLLLQGLKVVFVKDQEGTEDISILADERVGMVEVLMVPIALETSTGMGISPYPLMMDIAMAASSSFTSPISHPANVLVMGPGGYKFIDYVKVGAPLTLVILAVLMLVIPILWPLT